MISSILYFILRMKTYNGFIYRYDKNGNLIVSRNAIDCALGICSSSACFIDQDLLKKKV